MTTSVVIPSFNGRNFLAENLPVVLELGAGEVIVVDDASADDSVSFLAGNFPRVKVVRHLRNRGFPQAVNDGFAAASGRIVVLLNQDVTPDRYLLKYAVSHFTHPRVFAVTFNEDNRSWAKGEIRNGFLEFSNGPLDGKIHESLWASGGSAAFRKDLWDKFGGFDPMFSPGYFEDLDLSWRARRAGYKILWDPKCKVTHVTETAFNKAFSPRQLQLVKERNYLLAHWKNLTGKQLREHIYCLALRIFKNPGFIIPTLMAIWKKSVSS